MNNLIDLEAEHLTGAVVLLSLFMVIGFIGNLHVLLVYTFRIKPTNHGIYIIFLSIQDITASTLLIPLRIYMYVNLWTHGNEFTCRFESFLMCLVLTTSAFTLLLVATDRYRKICCPLGWQIKRRIAKGLCIIVLILACLCSWPVLAFSEPRAIKLNNDTVTICSTVDGYMRYQLYHRILMAAIFFGSLCTLIVLYVLIFKSAARYYSRYDASETEPCLQGTTNTPKGHEYNVSKDNLTIPEQDIVKSGDSGKAQDNLHLNSESEEQKSTVCNTRNMTGVPNIGPKSTNRSKKTTIAFTLITVFYFISYIPFISLDIFLVHGILTSSASISLASFVAIHIISTFVFVNSVANCFIYSCFDSRFRHEIGKMYRRFRCKL